MTIKLNRRAVSALAKLDLSGVPHAKRLEAFAETLGYRTGSAMMAAAGEEGETELQRAVRNIMPYLIWQTGPESPGHHPTMPSAIAALAEAAGIAPPARSDAKPVMRGTEEVLAYATSDDEGVSIAFDASEWLLRASAETVRKMARKDFGPCSETDDIYDFYIHDERVVRLKRYVEAGLTDVNGDQIGFSIRLDPSDAAIWLLRFRHDLTEDLITMRELGLLDLTDEEVIAARPDLSGDHDMIVRVRLRAMVTSDDLDQDDIDESGNDAISGDYEVSVTGRIMTAERAGELALSRFHDKIGIGNLDNYEIAAVPASETDDPEHDLGEVFAGPAAALRPESGG